MYYEYLWIALGSGLGGALRYWVSGVIAARWGESFPVGTLLVNVTGSFLIGVLASLGGPESRFLIPPRVRQFAMIGVLGGYTTFSSFSLQTLTLIQSDQWSSAFLNIGLSVALCLTGVWLGFAVGQTLSR